jgi:hypothetical protein
MLFAPTLRAGVLLLGLCAALPASTFSFYCITTPVSACGSGLDFDGSLTLAGTVATLTISNNGAASAISEVYVDGSALFAPANFTNLPIGWSNGANPANLPGGNQPGVGFSADFSAQESAQGNSRRIDAGETGIFTINVLAGTTQMDLDNAMANDSLRFGIHVQSIRSANGGSAAFVTDIPTTVTPEPASFAAVIGLCLGGLALRRKR